MFVYDLLRVILQLDVGVLAAAVRAEGLEGGGHRLLELFQAGLVVRDLQLLADGLPLVPLQRRLQLVVLDQHVGADGDAGEGHPPHRVVGGVDGGVGGAVPPLAEDRRDQQGAQDEAQDCQDQPEQPERTRGRGCSKCVVIIFAVKSYN